VQELTASFLCNPLYSRQNSGTNRGLEPSLACWSNNALKRNAREGLRNELDNFFGALVSRIEGADRYGEFGKSRRAVKS
jgi:hypothetical protein